MGWNRKLDSIILLVYNYFGKENAMKTPTNVRRTRNKYGGWDTWHSYDGGKSWVMV
jgi:hypothetical protein